MRPFVLGAKVSPLGCSRPLQRAIVDFAADQPFAQARAKLEEHYGFAIGCCRLSERIDIIGSAHVNTATLCIAATHCAIPISCGFGWHRFVSSGVRHG